VRIIDDPARARAFAGVTEDYDRARPAYPLHAVRWLLGRRALDVVDLGAGTGKLTELLVTEGHRTIAVEPLTALLDKLAQKLPDTTARQGSAEDIPLAECVRRRRTRGAGLSLVRRRAGARRDRSRPATRRDARPGVELS
jgi:hypothetical protein